MISAMYFFFLFFFIHHLLVLYSKDWFKSVRHHEDPIQNLSLFLLHEENRILSASFAEVQSFSEMMDNDLFFIFLFHCFENI